MVRVGPCLPWVVAALLNMSHPSSSNQQDSYSNNAHDRHLETSQRSRSKRKDPGFHSGTYHLETLSWAVQLNAGLGSTAQTLNSVADGIAYDLGLVNKGQVGHLESVYLFEHEHHQTARHHFHNLSASLEHVLEGDELFRHETMSREAWLDLRDVLQQALDEHSAVDWHSQQIIRRRAKRALTTFTDPAFPEQWHLVNAKSPRYDINVTDVWARNITGRGVTAVVVDDGLEWDNPDLLDNYNKYGSWDLNSNDADPMPATSQKNNHHGTRCAGEIAAVANEHCAVGVAYQANIAGIRVLDGPMTDSLEATAFTKNFDVNDIYSCSWGPDDDGKTVDGPHYLASVALRHGVEYGRQGYGSIYVVASGNGGRFGDNCNFDGYANSIYTITIGAVDESGAMPYYAEECASMLAVTFSSGSGMQRSIVTTDWTKNGASGCTEGHTGTSAAAPLAAGMVALMLHARPCLTWRDVQHIIVMTAVKVDVDLAHWTTNQAGLHHSHKHGFGLMNAWRLVNAAKVWEPSPWMTVFTSEDLVENQALLISPQPLQLTYQVTKEKLDGYNLYTLEYVQVAVTITHHHRGDLEVRLMCPSMTESVMAAVRSLDNSKDGFQDWTFSTVRCWGETAEGNWTLIVMDKGGAARSQGELVSWRLKLFGSPMTPAQLQDKLRKVRSSYSGQYLNDSYSLPCPPPPVRTKMVAPMSERILKVLVLTGVFCIFMAFYETLEYSFCYDEEKKQTYRAYKLAQRAKRLDARDQPDSNSSSENTRLLDAEEIPLNDISHLSADGDASCDDSRLVLQGSGSDVGRTAADELRDTAEQRSDLNRGSTRDRDMEVTQPSFGKPPPDILNYHQATSHSRTLLSGSEAEEENAPLLLPQTESSRHLTSSPFVQVYR